MRLSKKNLVGIFCLLLLLLACNPKPDNKLPNPEIKLGTAKVSGKIVDQWKNEVNKNLTVSLHFPNPITTGTSEFEIQLDEHNCFYFEVPLESSMSIGVLNVSSESTRYANTCVGLVSEKETKLEIEYNRKGEITVNMLGGFDLTSSDITNIGRVMTETRNYRAPNRPCNYFENPEEFAQYSLEGLKIKLEFSAKDSKLSNAAKEYVSNETKLGYLNYRLFDWFFSMIGDFNRCKPEGASDTDFLPQKPTRSYFSFLKDFDLNNPQYLFNFEYPNVLQTILSDSILNIPEIADIPVKDWLVSVKKIMADLIGTDNGLFYDLLVAHAYVRQYNNEQEPLSDKQKKNIQDYYSNNAIGKILIKKNEEIVALNEGKQALVINKTPSVAKENLMDNIISKHKGKVVLVDFWTTWCGPCLDAMKNFRKVKSTMKEKDICFVYISNASSPRELWEEKIIGIGGEHYYLSKDEWEYIFNNLNIDAIPTYLFYNANGELKNKITGYPGTEKMQQMIEELLP